MKPNTLNSLPFGQESMQWLFLSWKLLLASTVILFWHHPMFLCYHTILPAKKSIYFITILSMIDKLLHIEGGNINNNISDFWTTLNFPHTPISFDFSLLVTSLNNMVPQLVSRAQPWCGADGACSAQLVPLWTFAHDELSHVPEHEPRPACTSVSQQPASSPVYPSQELEASPLPSMPSMPFVPSNHNKRNSVAWLYRTSKYIQYLITEGIALTKS